MHETVLLHEAVEALNIHPSGIYVDGTFGRGGHSRLILEQLGESGRLIGVDKDPQAIATAKELAVQDKRFDIAHGSFADLPNYLKQRSIEKVDGILLDLGVSSPQLDQAERGFSFMREGPLDMRMNPEQGQSAEQWLASAKQEEIASVLKEYGEERYAKRIAGAIVRERAGRPITNTKLLAEIIKEAHPNWEKGKHPATKSFQGIRIFINDELSDLEALLNDALSVLALQGRLAIISFHSLEDRMVKQFMRRQAKGDDLPANIPVMESQLNKTMKLVGKAIKPSKAEVQNNIRSRSAVLRVAEKLGE